MKIKVTQVYKNGDKRPRVFSSDMINEFEPDTREDSKSNTILLHKEGFKVYITESFDSICEKLGVV